MKSLNLLAMATVTAFTLFTTACKKDSDTKPTGVGTLDMEFENTVGGTDLALNTGHYTTPAGDNFSVTKFKYIVSNLVLHNTDGGTYAVPNSYFLINEAEDSTLHVSMANVPAADYNSMSFVVGVDSARNVAGAQTGALSTDNDMYWNWNQGYIFLKFEGSSPQAPHQAAATEGGLVFHIGGFKAPNNCIRTVTLPMPSGTNLLIRTDHHPEIHLQADLLKLFSGPNPVRFADLSNTMGGANSVKVANNYANPTGGMFSVEHIHAY